MLAWLTSLAAYGSGSRAQSSELIESDASTDAGRAVCHAVGAQDLELKGSTKWSMADLIRDKHSEMLLLLEPTKKSDGYLEFLMPKTVDGVNDLTLLMDTEDDVIESLELCVGIVRWDGFENQGYRAAQVSGALWNKRLRTIDGTTFVPLPLALTHPGQYLPTSGNMNVMLRMKLQRPCQARLSMRTVIFERLRWSDFTIPTHQHQGPFKYDINAGKDAVTLPLNGPVTHIAVWGLDENAVERVKLVLNQRVLIDTDVRLLQYERQRRAPLCPALVLFLTASDLPCHMHAASVNMSRVDCARLMIETTQKHAAISVLAVNINVVHATNRLMGLKFSY